MLIPNKESWQSLFDGMELSWDNLMTGQGKPVIGGNMATEDTLRSKITAADRIAKEILESLDDSRCPDAMDQQGATIVEAMNQDLDVHVQRLELIRDVVSGL